MHRDAGVQREAVLACAQAWQLLVEERLGVALGGARREKQQRLWLVVDRVIIEAPAASELGGAGYTTAAFDPEADLLQGAESPDGTMAEKIVSMALLCVDDWACADDNAHAADLILLGSGYQGDRCEHTSGRQEQVEYQMDPHVMDATTSWTALVLDVSSTEGESSIESILGDANVQGAFAYRPLHMNSMLLSVSGHADANGASGDETSWGLYYSPDSTPRLRLKLRYDYYGTSGETSGTGHDIEDLLPCASNSATVY